MSNYDEGRPRAHITTFSRGGEGCSQSSAALGCSESLWHHREFAHRDRNAWCALHGHPQLGLPRHVHAMIVKAQPAEDGAQTGSTRDGCVRTHALGERRMALPRSSSISPSGQMPVEWPSTDTIIPRSTCKSKISSHPHPSVRKCKEILPLALELLKISHPSDLHALTRAP